MQQEVFTCGFVEFDDTVYAVYWLRLVLARVQFGKEQLRLLRINEKFSVSVRPFVLTDEVETLYAQYRDSITFDAPESVKACLLGGSRHTLFDTYAVEVRDGNRLIAVGIFDNGAQSIAGIMNFYHPDYRKQSLGKYLMLQKIKYAQACRKAYYYPGYLVHNYPKFDYKLFACEAATDVFDSNTGLWHHFSWDRVNALTAALLARTRIRTDYFSDEEL